MIAVKGVYDGKSVKLEKNIFENTPKQVIVLFPEFKEQIITDDISSEDLIKLSSDSGCFDFLDKPEENIYSISDGQEVKWQ